MKKLIKIATRQSRLALWQANFVKENLEKAYPDITVELLPILTEGDQLLKASLAKVGGKGLFIKELEKAILSGRADIAVHSVKDVPVSLAEGFYLAAVCERKQPYDALVGNKYRNINDLPHGAVIGTSSLRRQCQLKALRPDLQIKNLRGNLDTRLKKLDEGQYDAIIAAAAGLERLNEINRMHCILSSRVMLPAVGQGAIGVECHEKNHDIQQLVGALEHRPTRQCVAAERAVSFYLGGSCELPIGVFAELKENNIYLRALVGREDGTHIIRVEKTGNCRNPEALGKSVAEELLNQGADEILQWFSKEKRNYMPPG